MFIFVKFHTFVFRIEKMKKVLVISLGLIIFLYFSIIRDHWKSLSKGRKKTKYDTQNT